VLDVWSDAKWTVTSGILHGLKLAPRIGIVLTTQVKQRIAQEETKK
jgi:hypothetical protein